MFDILRRKLRCTGSALFRGTVPHGAEQLTGLAAHGVEAEAGRVRDDAHWTLNLRHLEWGRAEAVCLRDPPRPTRELLDFDPKLTKAEVSAIVECGVAISVKVEGQRGFVLRDRKYMLRFLDALLDREGVVAVDHTSETWWPRHALADELAHDGDLDVESIFTIHAVTESEGEDPEVDWFHTHGLAELGRFDFDILRPDRDFVSASADFCRALAFMILEGQARQGMTDLAIAQPFPPLHLLPAADFMREAAPADTALRDDPSDSHLDNRVVLCNQPSGGFLGRLVKGAKPRPSGAFRRGLPEEVVLFFSSAATELMADRARKTFPVLREIARETAEFKLPVLVKLGYAVDGGEPDDREHLWFEVHELSAESVDATLVNSPFRIARMQEGDRDTHSIAGLSDWMVLTPFGPINPHAFFARRLVREHREELRRHLAEGGPQA